MNINRAENIKMLIAEGQTKEALSALKAWSADLGGVYEKEIILQSGRMENMIREQNLGLLNRADYTRSLNQITFALFQIIDDLSKEARSQEGTKGPIIDDEPKRSVDKEKEAIPDAAPPPESEIPETVNDSPFYFTSLSLSNIRCFSQMAKLNFTKKNGEFAPWNIIIGDNGVGKTTVLRSLATVLLFYKNASEWRKLVSPDYFKRNAEEIPTMGFEVVNFDPGEKKNYQFQIIVHQNEIVPEGSFLSITDWVESLNIFAYGASRKIGSKGLTNENTFPASNLFDETSTLTNAEEWLIRTEYLALKGGKAKDTLEKVTQLLIQLLGENVTDMEIRTVNNTPVVMFKTDYGWVELHNLSMGHKTLVAWMVDFAKGLFDHYPESPNPLSEPAILLIDEIDLHLHPKLQRGLMKFLTKTFPRTQFIATAHSPLVVQSAESSNIILLKKEGDHVLAIQNPVEVKSWRVDQLLTSDLYGLSSAHSPETEEVIQRRRALLKKDNRSESEEQELEDLEEELIRIPISETPEAIQAMEILQKAAKKL